MSLLHSSLLAAALTISILPVSGYTEAIDTIEYNNTIYKLAFHHDNPAPANEVWEYLPEGNTTENWKEMITIHRFKGEASPLDIASAMAGYNAKQGSLAMFDEKNTALCFLAKDASIIEANAWRMYEDKEGNTWGQAIQKRISRDDQEKVEEFFKNGGPASIDCNAIKTFPTHTPASSKET